MNEKEIWKPIVGYEGLYEISNLGNVKSLNFLKTHKEKLISLPKNECGYLRANLYKKGKCVTKYVHRLVYEAFIGQIPKFNPQGRGNCRLEINHIDENPLNNRLDNLELVSHTYNNNFGSHNAKVSKKNRNGIMSKKVYQYDLDGNLIRVWPSTAECGRNGFNLSNVINCCNGRRNTHRGYTWSYKLISKQ